MAVAEVGECLAGCIEIVRGSHVESEGVDHCTVFDEFGHYLHVATLALGILTLGRTRCEFQWRAGQKVCLDIIAEGMLLAGAAQHAMSKRKCPELTGGCRRA